MVSTERSLTEPVYTIGVAASRLGIPVHSLRQYEAEGLVIPHKTSTGRRLYSDLEIEKIKCIKQMIREEGLNFAGIRRLMALAPCWKIRGCSKEERESCHASKSILEPCWASPEKCCHPYPSCRDCPVYRKTVHCTDLKKLIYDSTVEE
jgi:MerR family transcriptional regulator/heat shock protein HspR